MIHLDPTIEVKALAHQAFPNYTGRKFKLDNSGYKVNLTSHWDGGSRDQFVVLQLGSNATKAIPQNGTMFDRVNVNDVDVPVGFVIVEHSIFCGKDMGITFHVNPETAIAFLPEATTITDNERIVLDATARYKNSYGGETNVRFKETNRMGQKITQADWDDASNTLKNHGLLNKAGAITTAGKNAIA